uniref:Neural cell adhesion molecule L1 n=1 Tax=Esox lucius TaxID=8010 RepID=A0AAY5KQ77_ESOLU
MLANSLCSSPAVKQPPVITNQPDSITVFGVEDISLTCEASGNPPPEFRWTKDGEEFIPANDPGLSVTPGSGSFATTGAGSGPMSQYQGKYSCYASNELGTAVSNEVQLIAENPPALQKEKKVTKKVEEGESVVLKCNPPFSTVPPVIHWMDRHLLHIKLNDRVTQGRDGNLYFAHVTAADNRNDYTCNAQYMNARTILSKEPITLTVTTSNSLVRNRRPLMMRPSGSHSTYHALRGQSLELECIVQGLPTPTIQWVRKDGELSEVRTSRVLSDRLLRFSSVSESDAGEYQCTASNPQGKAIHTYTVSVEAAPYWTKEPVSQLYAPGETVRLDCKADGIPSPVVSWSINGIPITDPDHRRLVRDGVLILKDVAFDDTAVYQCQAHNKHGTILVNTYIYVIELPPQILTADGQMYTFVEGQKALLPCQTYDRSISSHIYGHRTVILSPPGPLRVQPGNRATFSCLAQVDSKLTPPHIQWRKDGQKLFHLQGKKQDDKMHFANEVCHSGQLCFLLVYVNMTFVINDTHLPLLPDRPDPPTKILISDQRDRSVTLSWTMGDDHNSPVIESVVEFEEQRFKEWGWEELKRVTGSKESVTLDLQPYLSYRFRVISVNDIGKSVPSMQSDLYSPPPQAPDKNPEGVRSNSTEPDTLVITWKMDKREFNGPEFHYRVFWRRVVGDGPTWHSNVTIEPPYTITDVGNFSAFEIKVQTANQEGEGPEPGSVIGYSGEDCEMMFSNESFSLMTLSLPLAVPLSTSLILSFSPSQEPERSLVVVTGPNEEKKVLGGLTPYSHYALTVTVFNNKGEGPHSETLSFKTDEGAPGPPMSLHLDSPSETEMTLHWTPPAQPNGVLKGYKLQHLRGNMKHTISGICLRPETVLSTSLVSWPQSVIGVYVWTEPLLCVSVCVSAEQWCLCWGGGGVSSRVCFPDPPSHLNLFSFLFILSFLSLSLPPSLRFRRHNPPSPRSSLAAAEMDVRASFATRGWFIGLVSATVLLFLVLLLLCFIKRNKGGRYSVKDKEEGQIDSEARPMKDETFGEYSDNEEKRTASQPSLCDQSKLCTSEDHLDGYNGSSAVTEVNMEDSLVSQYSRPSEATPDLGTLQDSSPLNPGVTTPTPTTNGLPNSAAILD